MPAHLLLLHVPRDSYSEHFFIHTWNAHSRAAVQMLWCQGTTTWFSYSGCFLKWKIRVLHWTVCFWLTFFNFHRNPPTRFWHPENKTLWFYAKKWSFPFGNTHRYWYKINFIFPAKRHWLVLTLALKLFPPLFLTRAAQDCLSKYFSLLL